MNKGPITGLPLFKRGKVRDIYAVGDPLLIVATDRDSLQGKNSDFPLCLLVPSHGGHSLPSSAYDRCRTISSCLPPIQGQVDRSEHAG